MKYIINVIELKDLELISRVNLFNALPWTKYSIIDYNVPGIYILFKEGNIIYVGKSINIIRRLYGYKNNIDWDSFSFIKIKDAIDRNIIESIYIKKYKPILNKDLL